MKRLFTLALILSAITLFAEETKQNESLAVFSQKQIDSLKSILDTSFKKQKEKIDSLSNATYVKQLETSTQLQTGKWNVYSLSFTILSVVIGVLAGIFTINFFASRREYQNSLKTQRDEHNRTIESQKKAFEAYLSEQKKQLEAYIDNLKHGVAKQNDLMKDIQAKNDDLTKNLIANVENVLKDLTAKGDQQHKLQIDELQKQIETVKKISEQKVTPPLQTESLISAIRKNQSRKIVSCDNCGMPVQLDVPPRSYKFQSLMIPALCSACGNLSSYPNPNY